MTDLKILARLAELPRVGTLFRHHKGGLVQVTGCGWDAGRDVAQVQYHHVKPKWDEDRLAIAKIAKVVWGALPNIVEHKLDSVKWHHDYTAEGWLRVDSCGVRRFEEVKG